MSELGISAAQSPDHASPAAAAAAAAPSSPPPLRVLTPEQLAHYRREGYVVVEDVLSASVQAAVLDEYNRELSAIIAELQAEGVLSAEAVAQLATLPFTARLTATARQSGRNW